MNPIYCTECLDRIPPEFFLEGKAAWSGGRPYLVKHATRLGLKLDLKPPEEFASAMGFVPPADDQADFEPTIHPGMLHAKRVDELEEIRAKEPAKPRCEIVIVAASDGIHPACAPYHIDLTTHTSRDTAMILGRDTRSILAFKPNVRISRRHCQLWMSDGNVFVEDLSSANKSFIDGCELRPRKEYYIFKNQLLTLGAKHSAIRVTLEGSGFPLLEEKRFATIEEQCVNATQEPEIIPPTAQVVTDSCIANQSAAAQTSSELQATN